MNRRALLAAASTVAVGALAGCTFDGAENPGTDDGNSPSPSPSPSPTPTPTPGSPRIADRSFVASDAECGGQVESAAVTSSSGDGYRVVVEGTTSTSTPCYRAELESATYDGESDELAVNVVTEQTGSEGCVQCIAEIDYEATVTFEGGLPETAVVSHDGERVTTAQVGDGNS